MSDKRASALSSLSSWYGVRVSRIYEEVKGKKPSYFVVVGDTTVRVGVRLEFEFSVTHPPLYNQ